MPKAYASAVIPAPPDAVWAVIRDFDGLPHWHPGIARSTIEDGLRADRVGCIRSFVLQDGQAVREKLLALSDHDRNMTYDFQTTPFPVRDYQATLQVRPISDGNESFVEWWATFVAVDADEAALTRTFADGVFRTGFDALKRRFTARQETP